MSLPSQDPIIVAPSPTPFREDDAVDFEAIEHNVARWLQTPLTGFVLNSENGEEAFLAEHERLEVVRTVRRAAGEKALLIGGIDSPSVTDTLRLAEELADAGVDLLRVRIPRLTPNVRGYFEAVARRAPKPLMVIHQMAPGMFLSGPTPAGASAEQLAEILSLDNVFGYIASADLRFELRLRLLVPTDKRFWMANASLLAAGSALGSNGACMMLGNVAPAECLEIVRLSLAGQLTEAAEIQRRILEVDWQILSRRAAGLKAALNLLGFKAGRPRSPTPPCTAEEIEQIRTALVQAKLLD